MEKYFSPALTLTCFCKSFYSKIFRFLTTIFQMILNLSLSALDEFIDNAAKLNHLDSQEIADFRLLAKEHPVLSIQVKIWGLFEKMLTNESMCVTELGVIEQGCKFVRFVWPVVLFEILWSSLWSIIDLQPVYRRRRKIFQIYPYPTQCNRKSLSDKY